MIVGTVFIVKIRRNLVDPVKRRKGACAQKICTVSIVDKVSIILVVYNYTCTA